MGEYVLGESAGETERLRTQAARQPIQERLEWGGVRRGMNVVDAGCGPGETSQTLARLVGPSGSVLAFDLSEARLRAARSAPPVADAAPITFVVGDVYAPPAAEGSADFVFCQFVFEYLREPQRAMDALARLLKPGGTLLVCDADGIGLTTWPLPEVVEQGIGKLMAVLASTGFDANVGRKLFRLALDSGLLDLRVALFPIQIFPGAASEDELSAWRQRFAALAPLGPAAFGDRERYEEFADGYLSMLSDPKALKYAVMLAVSGTRR